MPTGSSRDKAARELESAIVPRVRLALSRAGAKMFRNNVGLAWYGKNKDQPVKYGLASPGGSDLIGWTPIEVTEDMVGTTIAVFTAVEVKRPGGHKTPEQHNFVEQVRLSGGLAGFAESESDALAILKKT